MKISVIIPARSGSKRLKGKNIYKLAGVSLLERAVQYATQCNVDEIIVSSDAQSYLDSVSHLDVKLHQRSKFAASDRATDFDVLENIFNDGFLSNDGCAIAWIRPCSPFRSINLFEASKEKLMKQGNGSVRSVMQISERPEWMHTMLTDGSLRPILGEKKSAMPSNSLEPLFIWSGQLDMFFLADALKTKNVLNQPVVGAIDAFAPVPVDIDTPEDLAKAEAFLSSASSLGWK